MSDFRGRFLEDYAGGLLNVSKQEQSPTGEILAQNGFSSDGSTTFVEDGAGVKSGLKLGISLAECLEPTTLSGIVNVSYADRTYAKIKDLKIFATATASSQAALSQATVDSIQNLENSFSILEQKFNGLSNSLSTLTTTVNSRISSNGTYTLVYQTLSSLLADRSALKENQLAAVVKDQIADNNGLYCGVFNASTGVLSWSKIGIGIVGSTGPIGPSGFSGSTGISGPIGAMGATGFQGATGTIGATGATGFQGATGL